MIDTFNKFVVAGRSTAAGTRHTIINTAAVKDMTPDEALLCAAWLVAMAEPFAEAKFDQYLEAVKK